MKKRELDRSGTWRKHAATAQAAALAAGKLMSQNLHSPKTVKSETSHDIKLELDVRCQALIEKMLHRSFPEISFLGEEGSSGKAGSEFRWVVDPIDGTVNYAHGIPHAGVSIALQHRETSSTLLGVVLDPFMEELWTAVRGGKAYLNGRIIRVSRVRRLAESIVSIGFAKNRSNLERAMPYFLWLARRVRKVRIMGSAALALTYVASGRFDAYIERGIYSWDIAAGGLILECAGGKFWREPVEGRERFRMIASNGLLHRLLPLPR